MNMMLFILGVIAITASVPVQAGHAGAFIGGIAVAKIGQNMRDQTEAEQQQAYYAQQQAYAAQSNASNASSPEERIKQLDRLLAGGYISQQEYNAKKQEILNSL
jgi:membrane protease subunit (stomatin/prohibitin family)